MTRHMVVHGSLSLGHFGYQSASILLDWAFNFKVFLPDTQNSQNSVYLSKYYCYKKCTKKVPKSHQQLRRMTTIDDVTARIAAAQRRLDSLERLLDDLEGVKHVKQHLQRERLTSSALMTAPSDYYSWTLSQRA